MSSISEDVDDRLSTLHEDIRSCILSLMPTKFAVQTSILSKKWRYTWTLVTNLDFDDNMHENPSGLDRLVDEALMHCKSSQVKIFRLNVSNKCWVLKSSASSLIDKAVLLNVHELDIHVVKLEAPLSMFTCKTLTKLRINSSVHDKNIWLWPSSVYLPCLKTLDVAVYKNPFCNAFKLISGCPMLESLSLEVTERDDEENYIFNIPTLKRLKLTFSSVITKVINKVVLHVPNLEYLFIGGVLCSFYVMADVASLVEVHVSFCKIPYDHLWAELLKRIHGVKSLSTHNVSSLVDMKNPYTSRLPLFPNMKQLKLNGLWHSRLVLRHLRRTPWLKHLCIEKIEGYSWIDPKLVRALRRLTTIKFSKCEGKTCDVKFLEYIFVNAKALKKVTIIWENISKEEEMQLCVQLLKVPRASRNCEIHFVGTESSLVVPGVS